MNTNNLFFHIHYCNMKQFTEHLRRSVKLARTLQHHELIILIGEKGSAKGNIIIENKKYQIKEDMLLYLCPDIAHSVEINFEGSGTFMSVHFSYLNIDINKCNIRKETEILPLSFVQELKDYHRINNIFKQLVTNWDKKLPDYELITKALLQQLIFEILQNKKNQNQNFSTSVKVEKIIEYMHQNINKKITLTELSDMVKLSSAYLSRTFKDVTGYSVIEFFNKIKIDKAKELIIEGDKKVKEVAQAIGFIDEFYFSRVFKRIEGVSPTEFYSKNVHQV